jgi:hypothetical protein
VLIARRRSCPKQSCHVSTSVGRFVAGWVNVRGKLMTRGRPGSSPGLWISCPSASKGASTWPELSLRLEHVGAGGMVARL